MIIVIDGPAGSGKSTTAKEVARRAGIDYVDSGAIYRSFAYLFNENSEDKALFLSLIKKAPFRYTFDLTEAKVFMGEEEITEKIRTKEVNSSVSQIAALPEVRAKVKKILHEVARNKTVILEGRDLGTAVFPDAKLKFYLTADPEARALRRYDELKKSGINLSFDQVKENLEKRDQMDSTRALAPLKKAEDAIEIDSTHLTFDEQVSKILHYIRDIRTIPIQ